MMAEHEEFEVETDKPGELPMPFCSETVRSVTTRLGRIVPALPRVM